MPRTRTTTRPAGLLRQLDRNIKSAEQDLTALDKERDMLAHQLDVLRAARADLANGVLKEAATKSYGSRVDAIIEIFNEQAGKPVTIDEIMTELANEGRPDDKRLVHSTLSYLKRKGKVTQVDRGTFAAAA